MIHVIGLAIGCGCEIDGGYGSNRESGRENSRGNGHGSGRGILRDLSVDGYEKDLGVGGCERSLCVEGVRDWQRAGMMVDLGEVRELLRWEERAGLMVVVLNF